MKTIITAKLKVTTTPDQFALLRQTQLAYRDALNFVSAYSFAHGKTSNTKRLQAGTYAQVRAQFGLPAQMACSVPRQVGATYKGLWTKWHKNQEARAKGATKKRFKGLDQAPHYVSPTLSYVYRHDSSFKTDQHVSLLTLHGRLVLPYVGYRKHVALIQEGARIGGMKLWYDQIKKRFYVLVALELETPDPQPNQPQTLLGVDVGQRYLATVATLSNRAQFYSEKEVRDSRPLRAAAQTTSAARHSLGHPTAHGRQPTRETVEAEYQPCHQFADSGDPSHQFHRSGRVDTKSCGILEVCQSA